MTQPTPTTDPQAAAAEHHLARVTTNLEDTVAAEYVALTAYKTARRQDPAAQTTDDAREAWAKACRAWLDALMAYEQARDEVAALSALTPEEHAALTSTPEA